MKSKVLRLIVGVSPSGNTAVWAEGLGYSGLMVTATLMNQVESLSPDERLDLMGRIWDSLDPEPADHEIQEAKYGLALHRSYPEDAQDWDVVMSELRQKYL